MKPKYTTDSNILFLTISHKRDLTTILDSRSIEIIKTQKETAKKLFLLEKGQKGSKEYKKTFEHYEFLVKELNRENLFEFIYVIPKPKKQTPTEKYVPRKAKQKYTHKVIEFKGHKEISTEELLAENNRLIQRLSTFEPENLREALADFEKYKHIQAVLATQKIKYNKFKLHEGTYTRVVMLLGGKCNDCGTLCNITIHHVIPKSKGGTNDILNLELKCRPCHDRYHGMMPRNGILMKIINESRIGITA